MKRALRKQDTPKHLHKAWDALAQGAPDLLDDLDISRLRARAEARAEAPPRKKPDQAERRSQGRGVVYLRRHLPMGSLVYAVPNSARSQAHRFALMRDGMLPGMPDLGIIVPWPEPFLHRTFRIEWKREGGGVLSPAQIHIHEQLRALGVPLLSECRSTQEAVDWLREQGVEIT